MNNINIKLRTDADVASADQLVRVSGIGRGVMRSGIFDAVPRTDRRRTRA